MVSQLLNGGLPVSDNNPLPEEILPFPGLSERLDFFELLRRLERDGGLPVRLGSSREKRVIDLEVIQPADLAFASREVVEVRQQPARKGKSAALTIYCRHFGLFAPYGPLPIHVTEYARQEWLNLHNRSFQEFVALLSQRMAIWHYRAWSQLHVALGHERPLDDPFLHRINQLSGTTRQVAGDPHVERLRTRFAGAWLPGRMSWRALTLMLNHYFSLPVTLTPRSARWTEGDNSHQRLGRLGQTRIGGRFYDIQHAAQIRLGPVASPDYLTWQPGGTRLHALLAICRDYVGHQVLFDIDLHIATRPEMASRLGQGRLGRDGWLKTGNHIYKQNVFKQAY